MRQGSGAVFNSQHTYTSTDSRERERGEREILISGLLHTPQPWIEPTTQACALTGNQTHKPLLHWLMLQPTEPHRWGQSCVVTERAAARPGRGSAPSFVTRRSQQPWRGTGHGGQQARRWKGRQGGLASGLGVLSEGTGGPSSYRAKARLVRVRLNQRAGGGTSGEPRAEGRGGRHSSKPGAREEKEGDVFSPGLKTTGVGDCHPWHENARAPSLRVAVTPAAPLDVSPFGEGL